MRDEKGDIPENTASCPITVSLAMDIEYLWAFSHLLQGGVNIPARVECTLGNFLHEQLGLSREYVSERVTTIFVDGKATDSLEDTIVKNGSTIALSVAMPGVVGATLRRGSFYAAMRNDITSANAKKLGSCMNGSVSVKLFNLLLKELGPFLLDRGIYISPSNLSEFFRLLPDNLLHSCREVMINGKGAGPDSLRRLDRLFSEIEALLSVRFEEKSLEP